MARRMGARDPRGLRWTGRQGLLAVRSTIPRRKTGVRRGCVDRARPGHHSHSPEQSPEPKSDRAIESIASRGLGIVCGASGMQGLQGLGAASGALLAVQVKGQTAAELLGGADRVDAALRLAEAPITAFDRVA